ncbi:PEP-CTERM sorting domain-containing protein [Phycisphaerales bacterium AB-hyl4]|uniref:PEP-CTERM sorting domain-containing protein n=1 Tax=Natronomicrosphaera hydrolytica TaxID=3242702 RepID=A0ABV4U2R6_9BACT
MHLEHNRAVCASLVIGLAMGLAVPPDADASYWIEDFEQPTYTPGNIVGQDQWDTDANPGLREIVTGGTNGHPDAATGNQMMMLQTTGSTATRAHRQWSPTQITDPFQIEVSLAYDNAGSNGISGFVYIQNAVGFNGVIFGFWEGNFAGRDGNDWTTIDTNGVTPTAGTFYRFVVDIRPADMTWDLTIYDDQDQVLGSASNFASRNSVNQFSWIRPYLSDPSGPEARLYVDGISIIPEPASLALFSIGGLLFLRRRARTRVF